MPINVILPMCWARFPDRVLQAIQSRENYLFDKLGGVQCRYCAVVPRRAPTKSPISQTAEETGFKFIREHGPNANTCNQVVEGREQHINDPDGPIHNWDRGLVKESLRNYGQSKVLAKALDFYPLTLRQLKPWFLYDVSAPLLKDMNEKSILWLGRSGFGKSHASKTVEFTWTRHVIDESGRTNFKPPIRTAKFLNSFIRVSGYLYMSELLYNCFM